MKSTIRSVAAIALSTVCVSAAFAAAPYTPTLGERNFDLINSWFMPTNDKAMPAAAQTKSMAQTVATSKQTSDRAVSQTAGFESRGSM
jgi:hypothetical protein